MISQLVRQAVHMIRPRVSVGLPCPVPAIRSVSARRFTFPDVSGLMTMMVVLAPLNTASAITLVISGYVSALHHRVMLAIVNPVRGFPLESTWISISLAGHVMVLKLSQKSHPPLVIVALGDIKM